MGRALLGANFEVGKVIPGDANFNNRPGVNAFDFIRSMERGGCFVNVKEWASSTEVVSGTGATSVQAGIVTVATGTTHASTAGRYLPIRLPGTAENYPIQWDKKFGISFMAWITENGSLVDGEDILRILVTQSLTIVNLAAHGLGIKTNGTNINLATYGTGGSEQVVASSPANAFSHKDRIKIHIEHDPGVADRLYINKVLVATQSTAANIPSTEPAADYQLYVSWARSGGTSIANNNLNVENVRYGLDL